MQAEVRTQRGWCQIGWQMTPLRHERYVEGGRRERGRGRNYHQRTKITTNPARHLYSSR
jgi:hypothetical protein